MCHIGDLCSTSKAGLLLSTSLDLNVDIQPDSIKQEHSNLWMQWIGTAIADTVATKLKEMRAGDVLVTVSPVGLTPEEVAEQSAAGMSFPCTAKVEMHLTPKVNDAAANRASETVALSSFPEALNSALKLATRRHWLLRGVTVTVTAAEKLSIFIASNGDTYLPPESNRLQSASPRSSGDGTVPMGAMRIAALGVIVVAAVAFLVFRVKSLRPNGATGEEKGNQSVSVLRVEMAERKPVAAASCSVEEKRLLEGEEGAGEAGAGAGSFRRTVNAARKD